MMNQTDKRLTRNIIIMLVLWIGLMLLAMNFANSQTIKNIALPDGYVRVPVKEGSFGEYLRNQKLRKDNVVRYYDGKELGWQVHYAVLDIDIGKENLLQCADIVMRLRAEYLYKQERYSEIKFKYLKDDKYRYYKKSMSLGTYMHNVYMYANTTSLNKQMKQQSPAAVDVGDVFIAPGGHAAIIVDLATNMYDEKIMLIVQGYMPAQDIHIVTNSYQEHWIQLKDTIDAGWIFLEHELKTW